MGICHVVKNVSRKPVLIGPIEFDIVIVRDMSEKATENKVYCVYHEKNPLLKNLHCSTFSHVTSDQIYEYPVNLRVIWLDEYKVISVKIIE